MTSDTEGKNLDYERRALQTRSDKGDMKKSEDLSKMAGLKGQCTMARERKV